MADRDHHSIGEVLSLLKGDYPDITISKIRFLESQGLIDPERTPSGYRKFYDADIERLRWILTQQRDNFLPLKVIKRRLAEAGFEPPPSSPGSESRSAPEPSLFAHRRGEDLTGDPPDGTDGTSHGGATEPSDVGAIITETGPGGPPGPDVHPAPLASPEGSVSLTASELAAAAGVDAQMLTDLLKLGLIHARDTDGDPTYDHEALLVAKAAAGLGRRGLQAQHLRMFKVAADRESGVLDQLVTPMERKGDVANRLKVRDLLNELVRHGETIHRSLLRHNLGDHLD